MTLEEKISSFDLLGNILRHYQAPGIGGMESPDDPEGPHRILEVAIQQAETENPWFTREQVQYAFGYWGSVLTSKSLAAWLNPYRTQMDQSAGNKRVGVIMAGNIPMVGFHDMLSVLLTGNRMVARLSSQNSRLIPAIIQCLTHIDPRWEEQIEFTTGEIGSPDAVIATGSNNSSRYFDYYFGRFPNIIRKNRTGVAVLSGNETPEELEGIAEDVFRYYGLGCRNVSKFYLPEGYDFELLHRAFQRFEHYFNHTRYRNNLDYYRAIHMVNRTPFIDGGFYLFLEENRLATPVSVMHYEHYEEVETLAGQFQPYRDQIQCIVSHIPGIDEAVCPGRSQTPALNDYADEVDTVSFLMEKF